MIFAIGFTLFCSACLCALFCGGFGIEEPEWLKLIGGAALALGGLLMGASGILAGAAFFAKVMP